MEARARLFRDCFVSMGLTALVKEAPFEESVAAASTTTTSSPGAPIADLEVLFVRQFVQMASERFRKEIDRARSEIPEADRLDLVRDVVRRARPTFDRQWLDPRHWRSPHVNGRPTQLLALDCMAKSIRVQDEAIRHAEMQAGSEPVEARDPDDSGKPVRPGEQEAAI